MVMVKATRNSEAGLMPDEELRGDLLSKLGRVDEAHKEFGRAAAMAQNVRERELLLARAKACAGETGAA
jgi:predicted RNA polymerase sigma factor